MIINRSFGDKVFDVFNYAFLSVLVVITLYPCWFVLVASISDPMKIFDGTLLLYPKGLSWEGYVNVINYSPLWTGYKNTLFYVAVGGFVSVALTAAAAFALTRKGIPGGKPLMLMIVFTMYFSGGLIPLFLVVRGLGLIDNRLAMIFPNAVAAYNLIITVSFFRSLPDTLEEAAKIYGANEYVVFFRIMLPLAKPIIAVISLYYLVAIWNDFFNPMIYFSNPSLYPLQLILRDILVLNNTSSVALDYSASTQAFAENIKYSIIVVSTIPVLCVYPFIQKYFVKGVMIGAIKG